MSEIERAKIASPSYYLLRPDGHVGLAGRARSPITCDWATAQDDPFSGACDSVKTSSSYVGVAGRPVHATLRPLRAVSPIFITERLIARRLQPGDLAPMLAVYGDADAMRWVGDGKPITHDACVKWLQVTEHNYRDRGYGMFALVNRSSEEVLGFCGLVHPGGQPEAEIKYALKRSHWGSGLATEAAGAMLAYGATEHHLTEVIATTAPENVASHKVLLKAGMQRAELRDNDDGTFTQVFRWRQLTTPDGQLRDDSGA